MPPHNAPHDAPRAARARHAAHARTHSPSHDQVQAPQTTNAISNHTNSHRATTLPVRPSLSGELTSSQTALEQRKHPLVAGATSEQLAPISERRDFWDGRKLLSGQPWPNADKAWHTAIASHNQNHQARVRYLPSALKECLYVMIRMNSSSFTSPSPSKSALVIISCNSSSVMFSPSSRATLLRLRKEILPVSSSSKSLKTRRISSGESRSPILPVIISTNSSKSIVPEPSRSMSEIILRTFSFFESKPRARSATCNSFVSIVPLPSVSNRSNASRSSCICHSGMPGRANTASLVDGFFAEAVTVDVLVAGERPAL
mmetsp:Transcript_22191/g.51037  ORF Transcript_22191/g.51037 Transcript_22191/m.51037 type:complete len:316 (+) Transcript_22191:252-1199(+)